MKPDNTQCQCQLNLCNLLEGPRSYFEIGGGTIHVFSLTLYNFKIIGGGHVPPLPLYSAVPVLTTVETSTRLGHREAQK